MSKVYDCFMFFNELDVLELHLATLDCVVDKFVLVEANKTHSGEPKPLYFLENKDRFNRWLDKIIHVVVNFDAEPVPDWIYSKYMCGTTLSKEAVSPWAMEHWQREHISNGLKWVDGKSDNDIVIISDVDEIVSPSVVRDYIANNEQELVNVQMYNCFNKINLAIDRVLWTGPAIVRLKDLKSPADTRRCKKNQNAKAYCGGWHITWTGSVDDIIRKLRSFSHQELLAWVDHRDAIEEILEIEHSFIHPKILVQLPVTKDFLPEYVVENKEYYMQKGLLSTKQKIRLNLGCGLKPVWGAINIDVDSRCSPDLCRDVERGLPFSDNTIDEVVAFDFLEHIRPDSVLFVVDEIWRVLKPNGVFVHLTPSTHGFGAFQDPTHRSFWNMNSWLYFCDDAYRRYCGARAKFDILSLQHLETDSKNSVWHVYGLMRANKNFE